MPRGVAIAEPRQQLFAAAERIVVAAGPSGLTSRAVTREAGVATGLLFTHFAGFDAFLAGYLVDRSFQIAATAAGLAAQAGAATVAANLSGAVLATPLPTWQTVARLTAHQPALATAVEAVLGEGRAALQALHHAVAEYLDAEQRLGRVRAGADTQALALAVVGVLHHVALTDEAGPAAQARIRHALTALTALTGDSTALTGDSPAAVVEPPEAPTTRHTDGSPALTT